MPDREVNDLRDRVRARVHGPVRRAVQEPRVSMYAEEWANDWTDRITDTALMAMRHELERIVGTEQPSDDHVGMWRVIEMLKVEVSDDGRR